MKNKGKQGYTLLNTGMERKGLAFGGVYMKREGKDEYLHVEIGMAKREMNPRNHQSIIRRNDGWEGGGVGVGGNKQFGNSLFWIGNSVLEKIFFLVWRTKKFPCGLCHADGGGCGGRSWERRRGQVTSWLCSSNTAQIFSRPSTAWGFVV